MIYIHIAYIPLQYLCISPAAPAGPPHLAGCVRMCRKRFCLQRDAGAGCAGAAYQRRYARSNDPVIAARGLWLHNIHKVTVPQCRKPVHCAPTI